MRWKWIAGKVGAGVRAAVEVCGDPVAFARERLGFEPDDLQARLLATLSKRVIVNCTRQWGKSTVAAARAVWQAWSAPGSLTLVVSKSERQAAELVTKAEGFARRLGLKVQGDGFNRISLRFPNGSRIVGVASREDTARCFSVSLLILDEASCIPDEMYDAVLPMLAATGGSVWLLGTPRGKRGFFWETWARGGADWERWKVTAAECPRIDPSFIEEMRRSKGESYVRQEYFGEFVAAEDALFDRDEVDALECADVEALVW